MEIALNPWEIVDVICFRRAALRITRERSSPDPEDRDLEDLGDAL